jgi:Na+-translocating ferredoxin:NAD+ oxidoreductase subunit D
VSSDAEHKTRQSVRTVMLWVLGAMAPGVALQAWYYGSGVFVCIVATLVFALLFEAGALAARGMPISGAVMDGSVAVTAVILAVAVPPTTSIGVLAVGCAGAVLLGKHAYGGLGHNPFNPAMVGYAVLLVSFPAALSTWPAILGGVDAMTAATALDIARHAPLNESAQTMATSHQSDSWMWINLAFAGGGICLVVARMADWVLSFAMLAGVVVVALVVQLADSTGYGVFFHLLHGATMVGAFFVVTDPVTAPAGSVARFLFAFSIGALLVIIREYGGYPDGLAFAVLLGNALGPVLERVTRRQAT